MSNIISVTAHVTDIIADGASVCEVFGQGCNYPTKYGVTGMTVCLLVNVLDDVGGNIAYSLTYQSDDRTDNIMAYNGVDMAPAHSVDDDYGFLCELLDDADEVECTSAGKTEYLSVDDFRKKLAELAEHECALWLADNIQDLLGFEAVQDAIKSEISRQFNNYQYWLVNDDELEELSRKCAIAVFNRKVGIDLTDYEPNYDDLLTNILDTAVEHAKELRGLEYRKKTNIHGSLDLSDEADMRKLIDNDNNHDELFVNIMERALAKFAGTTVDDESRTTGDEGEINFGFDENREFFVTFAHVLHRFLYEIKDGEAYEWGVNTWDFEQKRSNHSLAELCYDEFQLQLTNYFFAQPGK